MSGCVSYISMVTCNEVIILLIYLINELFLIVFTGLDDVEVDTLTAHSMDILKKTMSLFYGDPD